MKKATKEPGKFPWSVKKPQFKGFSCAIKCARSMKTPLTWTHEKAADLSTFLMAH